MACLLKHINIVPVLYLKERYFSTGKSYLLLPWLIWQFLCLSISHNPSTFTKNRNATYHLTGRCEEWFLSPSEALRDPPNAMQMQKIQSGNKMIVSISTCGGFAIFISILHSINDYIWGWSLLFCACTRAETDHILAHLSGSKNHTTLNNAFFIFSLEQYLRNSFKNRNLTGQSLWAWQEHQNGTLPRHEGRNRWIYRVTAQQQAVLDTWWSWPELLLGHFLSFGYHMKPHQLRPLGMPLGCL